MVFRCLKECLEEDERFNAIMDAAYQLEDADADELMSELAYGNYVIDMSFRTKSGQEASLFNWTKDLYLLEVWRSREQKAPVYYEVPKAYF